MYNDFAKYSQHCKFALPHYFQVLNINNKWLRITHRTTDVWVASLPKLQAKWLHSYFFILSTNNYFYAFIFYLYQQLAFVIYFNKQPIPFIWKNKKCICGCITFRGINRQHSTTVCICFGMQQCVIISSSSTKTGFYGGFKKRKRTNTFRRWIINDGRQSVTR